VTPVAKRSALFLSSLFLLAQAFTIPSPVRDAATSEFATGFQFQYSLGYSLFAPFCTIADVLTVLSAYQLIVFVVTSLVLGFAFLSWRKALALFLFFFLFVAWGTLAQRPVARLVAQDPDVLLLNFHSHTQRSHDGRPSFTPDKNRTWHRTQGYGANFITDHNRIDAAEEAYSMSLKDWQDTGFVSLRGEEISLLKTHLVVLGVHERIDNQPFDSDPSKVPAFIKEMDKKGKLVIASLPEYWFYHWGEGLEQFVKAGVDGFEVINSAPKALDFPLHLRSQVIDLCRSKNLFITGISDTHGYGSATAVWNAMRIPGWRQMDPDSLEKAIISRLKIERFSAVQVLERVRFVPASKPALGASFFMAFLSLLEGLTPLLCISWVAWIFFGALLYSLASPHIWQLNSSKSSLGSGKTR
jgi:hypothetical protein